MITLRPVPRALVPADSPAAARISGPNYDEFQDDAEIQRYIASHPASILRVTMAHADVPPGRRPMEEGSEAALAKAAETMRSLAAGELTRTIEGALWVYEMVDPARPAVRQIGLGGLARTAEIRTPETPAGPILRNEGIREHKARGRADLIERTSAIVGTVNHAVDDGDGALGAALEHLADGRVTDLEVADERGVRHRVWLVTDEREISELQGILAAEPRAYVADGNHRSAAAAMLGYDDFVAVFFPARSMDIRPYNRLVAVDPAGQDEVLAALQAYFEVRALKGVDVFQPERSDRIGLYVGGAWYQLAPRPGSYDPENAAEAIAAGIVQKNVFARVLGIADDADPRLRFVGSNRDAAYLRDRVDAGEYGYAVTLPAVTMDEFIRVCLQGRLMPPKSTWFEPKLRSGLVIALL